MLYPEQQNILVAWIEMFGYILGGIVLISMLFVLIYILAFSMYKHLLLTVGLVVATVKYGTPSTCTLVPALAHHNVVIRAIFLFCTPSLIITFLPYERYLFPTFTLTVYQYTIKINSK